MTDSPVFISKEDFYQGSPYLGGGGGPGVLTPTITSLTPDTLPETAPATTITVTGTNYVDGSRVRIQGVPRPTTFVSETELTIEVDPNNPVTVNFTVENPGSSSARISNAVPFIVTEIPPPVITSLDPTAIPANIASDIVVTGTGFLSVPDMKAWVNGTEMPGAPESDTVFNFSVNFVSSNPEGTSANVQIGLEGEELLNTFPLGIIPTPAIASLSPNTAVTTDPAATVTVTGTGFLDGAVVQIDGAAQTTTFVSATQLTVSYDPTTAGTKQFTVRHTNGHVSAPSPFTVTEPAAPPPPPVLTSLLPYEWSIDAGGIEIKIDGTGFLSEPDMVVWFDGVNVGGTIQTDTRCIIMHDPTVAGPVQIQVGRVDREHSNALTFTATAPPPPDPAPVLTSITPTTFGVDAGATSITVTGTGFTPTMVAKINGAPVTNAYVSATEWSITGYDPTVVGTAYVTVATSGGLTSNGLPFEVTAAAPPTPNIASLSPNTMLDTDGPTTVTITGTGFVQESDVQSENGMNVVSETYVSATQMTASIDPQTAGAPRVMIINPGGVTSNAVPITITDAPALPVAVVTALTPNTLANNAGPTTVTVTGTDFMSDSVIKVDFVAVPTTFVSDTTLTTSFTPTTLGTKMFAVVNRDGASSNAFGLSVTPPGPSTGATAGTPGTWTPPGSLAPMHPEQVGPSNIAPTPATHWLLGEHVQTLSNLSGTDKVYWNGTSWQSWDAPNPPGAQPATSAYSGQPGFWQPNRSIPPADFAGLASVAGTAPTTAWTDGDYVVLADASEATWDGTAWQVGRAPGAAITVTAQQVHDWSIQEVKDVIRDHPSLASEIYELEKDGDARPGILNWLKTLLDEEDTTT